MNLDARGLHDRAWAEACDLIDLQLSPLGLAAMRALALPPGAVVLDVGCGAGQTLGQLADLVGADGRVVGIDVSGPLLAVAARRTRSRPNVGLIRGDAEAGLLAAGSLDAVYSRFGVMGFRDPVAAFTAFRDALRPSGRLAFVCWQALDQNELDRLPLAAAGFEAVGDSAAFSFGDSRVVDGVLRRAGFGCVEIHAHRELVSSGDVDAMTGVLLRVGPLGRMVREDPGLRGTAEPRLRAALAGLGDPGQVCLAASVWIVTARAP